MTRPITNPVVWSQRHPLLVFLLALLLLFGGLLAVGRLSVDPPSLNGYPQIRVRILDPGVPAAIMEERVTRPLEQALADMPELMNIVSVSAEGSAEVVVFVHRSHTVAEVYRRVAARIDRARSMLPATIDAPQLEMRDGSETPVAELAISSTTQTLAQLQQWTEESFVPQLTDIAGFGRFEIIGGPMREIEIIPDQRRLAALGLALEDVVSALRHRVQAASGRQITLAQASAPTVAALSLRLANGDTVALSEVARVRQAETDGGARVYRDATPVLRLLLYPQSGMSTLGMAEAFKSRLAWLRANALIPSALRVEWSASPLTGLKRMGRSFLTLSTGALLLTLVAGTLFLRNARVVFLLAATAVISLMSVFAWYKVAGLTLNVMSLGGMVLGYGFVLGLPQVSLLILRGPSRLGDNAKARPGVGRLLITILIAAGAALSPLLVFGGLPGLVFHDLITAFAVTSVASILVSLILLPAFAPPAPPAGRKPRASGYSRVLTRLSGAPRLLALIVLVPLLVIPGGIYYGWENLGFLPRQDTAEVLLYVEPPADIGREQVAPLLRQVEVIARHTGDVVSVLTQAGGTDPEVTERDGANATFLRVELLPDSQRQRSAVVWIHDFEQALAAAAPVGLTVHAVAPSPLYLVPARFEDPVVLAAAGVVCLRIYGPDRTVLAQIGAQMVERLSASPGLRDVRLTAGRQRPELLLQFDPERAAEWALDDMTTARALRIARGGLVIGSIPDAGHRVALRVALPQRPVAHAGELPRLLLRGEADDRPAVYLNDVADGVETTMPLERWRERQYPMVEVRAGLSSAYSSAAVTHAVRDLAEHYSLPADYRMAFVGLPDGAQRSRNHALSLIGFSLALLLVVLGIRLRSVGRSLLILFNVVFALTGVACGLVWTGLPWSLPLGVGGLLLMVLAAAQALVALDGLHAMRGARTSGAAIVAAAPGLWRRALGFGMCSFFCLVPLASGLVPGFEVLQPLGLVMSLGMLFSLLGNLLLTPVLYGRLSQ